jgi:hypothetical protein
MSTPLTAWSGFFAAEAGATAALAGLIFVGVSISLPRVLSHAALPDRAAESIMQMIGGLIVATLGLIPDQPLAWFGVEVLLAGGALWLAPTLLQLRYLKLRQGDPWSWIAGRVVMNQLATLPFIATGVLVLIGSPVALYPLAAGFVFSIIGAVTSAWVLLVEIHR